MVNELLEAGLLPHPSAGTVNGNSIGENCADSEVENRDVIKTCAEPILEDAGFLNLKGNLFDSAIMKTSVISDEFRDRYLTNPDDPMDLGAEVEMYMGPELERHVINRTCCIWIPPNFIHAPWRPIKTDRPWIFIEVNQGPSHTEKSYRQLLPQEVRDKMDWSMWLDEGYKTPA